MTSPIVSPQVESMSDLIQRLWNSYAANALTNEAARVIEQQVVDLREGDDLRERLSKLLSETAIAIKGPEAPLSKHSWHDLPELAKQQAEQIATLTAEVARLNLYIEDMATIDANSPAPGVKA